MGDSVEGVFGHTTSPIASREGIETTLSLSIVPEDLGNH